MSSNGESQLDLCMFTGVQMLMSFSAVTANAARAEGLYYPGKTRDTVDPVQEHLVPSKQSISCLLLVLL